MVTDLLNVDAEYIDNNTLETRSCTIRAIYVDGTTPMAIVEFDDDNSLDFLDIRALTVNG